MQELLEEVMILLQIRADGVIKCISLVSLFDNLVFYSQNKV